MRYLVTAAAAAALLAGCASEPGGTARNAAEAAAAAEAAPDAKTVATQIEAVEKAWGDAILRKDQAELERLLAPEFVLAGSQGRPDVARDTWLTNLALMEVTSYAVRVTGVRMVGNTAVATVEGAWTVAAFGQAARLDRFKVEDTWVRRGGRWQAIRRTRVDAPAAAA
ncbi:MAG TPA: nuclear transport factor 2 family protein [Caulobacteraceae bacterium]|jgi:hypothetical protein